MAELTTAQVADRAGVSTRKVQRMVERGELTPASKFPGDTGGYLFELAEVRRAFPNLPQATQGESAEPKDGGPPETPAATPGSISSGGPPPS